MSENTLTITPESAREARTKAIIKREQLGSTNPSFLFSREVGKHTYAYEVVKRLNHPAHQYGDRLGLGALITRANVPTNKDRLTMTDEENPGGIESEALALLQSLGVLEDIPTETEVIWDSSKDPEGKFERLRNFPKLEKEHLKILLLSKIENLSILMVLRNIATNKSTKHITKDLGMTGKLKESILGVLQDKKILTTKNRLEGQDKPYNDIGIDTILLDTDEARAQFFRELHDHPDISLPPQITFIPVPKPILSSLTRPSHKSR